MRFLHLSSLRRILALVGGLAVLAVSAIPALAIDDRDLFSAGSETPYLFVLLDTSGSMHWKAPCNDPDGCSYRCPSEADLCKRICPRHICTDDLTGVVTEKPVCSTGESEDWLCETGFCPNGDCFAPLNGDDPGSKFFQAKSAIYQVIEETIAEKIPLHVGFGTFNQDQLRMQGTHWLYNLQEGQTRVTLNSGRKFPREDIPQVFGRLWDCRNGPDVGFEHETPATLGQTWQETRMYRCPQLGQDGNQNSFDRYNMWYFVDPIDNKKYRVEFQDVGGPALGQDDFQAHLHVDRCNNFDCSSRTRIGEATFKYDVISEYTSWDLNATDNNDLAARQLGFFPQGVASDSPAGGTCNGWDPNDDLFADIFNSLNIRFPNGPTDPLGSELTIGDVLPLDWRDDHRDELLERLAPNRALGGLPGTFPDFRVATYFEDNSGGNLDLNYSFERPVTAFGSTPLAGSVDDFRSWYLGWRSKAENATTGDRTIGCKDIYLLMITDGDETCGGNPCAATQVLYGNDPDNPRVQTYVIGYGLSGGAGNSLLCMPKYLVDDKAGSDPEGKCLDAAGNSLLNGNGVCQKPFFAGDQQQLIDALKEVVRNVTGKSRAFATAAVPSVQATVSDKIFLSNFIPVPAESYWDGHINAFLKPLPLDANGKPDTNDPNFLWDVGKVVAQGQVPGGDKLGGAGNQRRVYYSLFSDTGEVPKTRRLLEATSPTDALQLRRDLWFGMDICNDGNPCGNTASQSAAESEANAVIDTLFSLKQYNNPDLGLVDYIIGDVFHSDPVLVGTPPNTLYFTLNLQDNGLRCDDDAAGEPINPGYRCFTLKHENRRKVLFAGTNEGILHGFDAGLYDATKETFDNGSGRELFGYVPRGVLPTVKTMAQTPEHHWTVDGTFVVDDVFIDPAYISDPDEDDREWRTVGVGGLRQGGVGYYALDVTAPDPVQKTTDTAGLPLWIPQPRADRMPACWGGDDGDTQPAACGEAPYPIPLWEFNDTVKLAPLVEVSLDEEPSAAAITVNGRSEPVVGNKKYDALGNIVEAYPDLGESWSDAVIGRIAVCGAPGTNCDPSTDGNTVEDRYVAIFGGGYDPELADIFESPPPTCNGKGHRRGNWIYMVDIETGETIYKQMVLGSVPGEVATLDINGDGYLDRIYAGTTRGFLYRIDLLRDSSGDWPAFQDLLAEDVEGSVHDVSRLDPTFWQPRVVFDANETNVASAPCGTLTRGRAVFLRPEIAFVPQYNAFSVVFGTGYRDVLWSQFPAGSGGAQRGRVFVFLDDTDENDPVLDETDLTRITPGGAAQSASNLLTTDGGGWFLDLEPDERLTSVPFILSGVLVFNTYTPDDQSVTTIGGLCQRQGSSRVYGVFLLNGNGLLAASANDPEPDRFKQIDDFITAPFTEPGQTKNPTDDGSGAPEPTQLTAAQAEILNQLKQFLPPYCRFASYTRDVKITRSDTGIDFIAPIPVCLVQKNWREF